MADARRLERTALVGIGAVTAATGALQAAAPALTLGPLGADDSPAARHFFGTVGMFMVCTGSLAAANADDPGTALMTAGQKLGAAVAVAIGVRRGLLSPLALAVAAIDGLSGALALDYRRRFR